MLISWILFSCLSFISWAKAEFDPGDNISVHSEASIGKFLHIVTGKILFINYNNVVLFRSDLRNLFPDSQNKTLAIISISPEWADSSICNDKVYNCAQCYEFPNAAVIRGKEQIKSTPVLMQLSQFDISQAKSIQLDLGWTKICTNLTYLPNGEISAKAILEDYHVASKRKLAEIEIKEYPIREYSEIVIENVQMPIDQLFLYDRPIDSSITSIPCSETVIGQKKNIEWLDAVSELVSVPGASSTSLKIHDALLTNSNSLLGSTFFAKINGIAVCGTVKLQYEEMEKVIYGAVFADKIQAWVKLSQSSSENSAFIMPVEMSYFIIEDNEEKRSKMEKAFALLDIVTPNSICKSAIPFDPFKIMSSTKLTECQNDKQLCPLGALSKRAASLKIGIRKHIVIEDLPLTGPIGNKISGHSIRIKTQDGHVDCAPLERWYETPFRFVVQSNRSLENIQNELASKLDVKPFQIAIDYTRELHEDMCSIYNIVLTANINSTQHFLSKFDMYEKRFFGEQPVPCSKEEMSRLASSNSVSGLPKTINWFSPTILSLFLINLFL